MRKIKISEDAYCDIEEMFSYISQDNKMAAKKLRQKIYNGIKNLVAFPFKYCVPNPSPYAHDLLVPKAETLIRTPPIPCTAKSLISQQYPSDV